MRVLVVEDEDGLAGALRVGLVREGYAVDLAETVTEARDKLGLSEYDVVLLDVNLPDGSGFTLAEEVRRGQVPGPTGSDVRMLMLTARTGLPDRVRGLDVGADDYLVKPFALQELTARMRALLRRDVRAETSVLVVGDLSLDTSRHLVHRGATELSLTLKEFAVLRYLMRRPGHLVSAEELLEHVWDENADPLPRRCGSPWGPCGASSPPPVTGHSSKP